MGDDDHERKILNRVADLAEKEADSHSEGCFFKPLYKGIAKSARDLATENGPAQVATPEYRDNWETIFGKKMPVGSA